MTGPESVSRMMRSRNAGTGVRVNNRTRKKRLNLTRRQVFLVVVMLFMFMGSSIGYVWSNFERTRIGYNLSELKQKELELREMNRRLRLELAFLKSPQRLETVAREELGLREPSPEDLVILP